MAEKTVKAKQPEKAKQSVNTAPAEKPKQVQKARVEDKDRDKSRKPNAISQWWRETVGELRKVNWPSVPDARRLTLIVLAVMAAMSLTLGLLDYLFSLAIGWLVTL